MSAFSPARSAFAVLVAGLLVTAALPAQNLLSNASFENPALTDPETNYQLPTGSAWLTDWATPTLADTSSTNSGVRHINTTASFSASDGAHYVSMSGTTAYLAQFVDLVAGQTYLLTFDIIRPAAASGSLALVIDGGAGDLFSETFGIVSGVSHVWESKGFEFTAAETDAYLFRFSRASGSIGLDNIVLSAIPEPAAVAALAGLGALCLVGARRRRRT